MNKAIFRLASGGPYNNACPPQKKIDPSIRRSTLSMKKLYIGL